MCCCAGRAARARPAGANAGGPRPPGRPAHCEPVLRASQYLQRQRFRVFFDRGVARGAKCQPRAAACPVGGGARLWGSARGVCFCLFPPRVPGTGGVRVVHRPPPPPPAATTNEAAPICAHQQAARALQTLGSLPLPSCVWRGQFTNVGPRLVSPASVDMAGGSRPPPWAPTPPPNPPLHNSLHRRAPIQSARCSGASMQRPSANVSMCASSLYTREAYNCKAFSLFLEHHATLRSSPPPPDAVARAFGVCVRCRRARGPGAARRRLWPTCLPLFHFQPACPAGRSNAKECFPLSSFIAMPF